MDPKELTQFYREPGQLEHPLPVRSDGRNVGVKIDEVRLEYLVNAHHTQHVLKL